MILVNNANSVNTDNDVSSSSTAGNTNTDAASEQQSLPVGQEVAQDGFAAQVATADSDSNDDMEGSTNESKGDNAFTSSKSQVTSVLGSPEIPRSIETIVRTQILVVAPDRIEQMTMSEPQPLRAFESSISASAAALTASASLLSVYNLFALSLAAAAIFITSQWM
ncbi:hypothetical protein GGI25_000348 [Coemansia spiralis]|uniref:Uncharacterized protein n=2 Tax=Coemansia TaxID=4863 RepID=A0A9W8L120_9FUNG|nr:hypothetical protein EDC05_000175 [Coemansia umbellata]KAJ2625957.1 hypothetical protein GGI26_000041 [Coemansia sp. RSA 1358]KAJ2680713.1 hypothetical protein GGI25_000348 [Coemansia spiralis]